MDLDLNLYLNLNLNLDLTLDLDQDLNLDLDLCKPAGVESIPLTIGVTSAVALSVRAQVVRIAPSRYKLGQVLCWCHLC